jgi:hypothetical protein
MSVKRERRRAREEGLLRDYVTIYAFVNLNMWILSCTNFRNMLHVCDRVHSCAYLHPSLFDPGSHATRPATHLTGVSWTEERSSENEATDQVDHDLVLQNVMLFELPIHPQKGHACTKKKMDTTYPN